MFFDYRGLSFDSTGQNKLGAIYLTPLQGKDQVMPWPPAPDDATRQ